MKKILLIALALTFVLAVPLTFYAQPEMAPVSVGTLTLGHAELFHAGQDTRQFLRYLSKQEQPEEQLYADSFAAKAGDGAINTATFWMDLPREMGEVSEDKGILAGCTLGFGKGMVEGFTRGMAGTYDLVTFGLPPYNQPAMQPAYKVDQPEREGFKIKIFTW